jgi:hypothetical protein
MVISIVQLMLEWCLVSKANPIDRVSAGRRIALQWLDVVSLY